MTREAHRGRDIGGGCRGDDDLRGVDDGGVEAGDLRRVAGVCRRVDAASEGCEEG